MANNNSLQLLMDVWAKWLSLVSVPLVRKKKYRKKKYFTQLLMYWNWEWLKLLEVCDGNKCVGKLRLSVSFVMFLAVSWSAIVYQTLFKTNIGESWSLIFHWTFYRRQWIVTLAHIDISPRSLSCTICSYCSDT